jgi:hypothetical protein
MHSRLYHEACASLTDVERQWLSDMETWLFDCADDQIEGLPRGERLLGILRAEAHLVGDEAFGKSETFTSFLRDCLLGNTTNDWEASLTDACAHHQLNGLTIPLVHIPDSLSRYTTSRTLLADLVTLLLGSVARIAFDNGDLAPVDACSAMADQWDTGMLGGLRLARGNAVFATFDPSDYPPAPHDAIPLTKSLALLFWQRPRTGDEILFELRYESSSVENHRFPTVADAQWANPLFLPAPEIEPREEDPQTWCGWTSPLGGESKRPEIVHQNSSLQMLTTSPRFIGIIPLGEHL